MNARSSNRVLLHLLRHADAGDPGKWTGSDAVRPLSPKGERQSERLGAFLASVGFQADAFVTSPKLRAAQTAEIVAAAVKAPITVDERMAEGFGLHALNELLAELGVDKPVLVGHDPDFSELLAELSGAPGLEMKKGAFARIEVELPATPGAGRLRWLVPPDLLEPR